VVRWNGPTRAAADLALAGLDGVVRLSCDHQLPRPPAASIAARAVKLRCCWRRSAKAGSAVSIELAGVQHERARPFGQ
jgi:hypothetical protein